MAELLIRGGRVIDPANKIDEITDVLIDGGCIAAIGSTGASAEHVIDGEGLIVSPGFVDVHCHLRDPGFSRRETIASGTKAAAAGGYTTILPMANTDPVADNAAVVTYELERARTTGVVKVLPIGAVSKGLKGEFLAEMGSMAQAGAVAFSDDGKPVTSARLMRLALEYSKIFGLPVIAHEEVLELVDDGDMNEGYICTSLGLRGIPAAAEAAMIARDLLLQQLTGGKLHIAHVSAAESVDVLRAARAKGVPYTAEVTPHHLTLTEETVGRYDTNAKVNPPLRRATDVAAVLQALKDGVIDCIATDHAPHTAEDKRVEFHSAKNGISGFETAFPLLWTELVLPGKLDAATLIERLTWGPARALKLPGGTLSVGAPADIAILDPAAKRVVDPQRWYSRGKNTPLAGRELTGWPVYTLVDGRIVMKNGEVLPCK